MRLRRAKKRIEVSVGKSVRIIRELQGLSQTQLAQRAGISQVTLSAIENGRVREGHAPRSNGLRIPRPPRLITCV